MSVIKRVLCNWCMRTSEYFLAAALTNAKYEENAAILAAAVHMLSRSKPTVMVLRRSTVS